MISVKFTSYRAILVKTVTSHKMTYQGETPYPPDKESTKVKRIDP